MTDHNQEFLTRHDNRELPKIGSKWKRHVTHRTDDFRSHPLPRRIREFLTITEVNPRDPLGREILGVVTSKEHVEPVPYACTQIIFNAYWESV